MENDPDADAYERSPIGEHDNLCRSGLISAGWMGAGCWSLPAAQPHSSSRWHSDILQDDDVIRRKRHWPPIRYRLPQGKSESCIFLTSCPCTPFFYALRSGHVKALLEQTECPAIGVIAPDAGNQAANVWRRRLGRPAVESLPLRVGPAIAIWDPQGRTGLTLAHTASLDDLWTGPVIGADPGHDCTHGGWKDALFD